METHPLILRLNKSHYKRFLYLKTDMVLLLPPLASIPSLWSSPLLDNSYLSDHIFKVSARSGKRILKNIKESFVFTLVEGILIDKKAGKSYKIKEQHWIVSEGLGSLRVYLLESPLVILTSSPSLDEIISGIENGNQTLQKIADRILLFNDFAVDLTLMEIREDIQKLLADAQFLLSSTLGETLVKKRMADLLIPSWDSLFCIIEKHCMQQTYDIIFFKICKNNIKKDEMIANIMKKTRLALLGGIRLNISTIIEIFQEIEQVRSPFEKIQILKKSIQAIIDSKSSLSNDELLPIFITVVLRSQVSSLYSNLELITLFTFEKKVDQGEIGYLIATLEACADFILNNEEDLEANSIFFEEFQNTLETKDLDKIDQFYGKKFPKHVDKNMHSFCDQYGNDAVMLSMESPKLIEYFLTQKKFDPSFQSLPTGNSYFHLCASKNLIESAKILAEKKADATLVNSDGETPFCVAIQYGYIDFAKMLVSYNNSVKNHIIIPRVFQLLSNNSIALDYLLAFPINFNNVFVGDKSLLTYFCSLAKPELAVSLLTSSKLNPSNFCSQDAYGKTFVHYCCNNVDNYVVAISFFKIASSEIIEKTLSVLDIDGNTALHIAALNDNFKMVRELLQHQKNIEIRNLRDLAAFEMTFDEKIVAEILNERIIRYSQIRNIGISVFSHSRWIANGKLTFQIRSVKKKNIENVHVVKRSLDEFTYFRECLILERPESVIPDIHDMQLNQNILSGAGNLNERGIRSICSRLERFLLSIAENIKFQGHELLCEFLEADELHRESIDTRVLLKHSFFEDSISAPSSVADLPFIILEFKSIQNQIEEMLFLERKIADLVRKQGRLNVQAAEKILESAFKLHNPTSVLLPVYVENLFIKLALSAKRLASDEIQLVSNSLFDQNHSFSGGVEGLAYFNVLSGEFEALEKHCNSINDELKLLGKKAALLSSSQEDLIDKVDHAYHTYKAVSEELRKKAAKVNSVADSLKADLTFFMDTHSSLLQSVLQAHTENHIKYLEKDIKILQALLCLL